MDVQATCREEQLAGELVRVRHSTETWFCGDVYDGTQNRAISGAVSTVPPVGSTVVLTGSTVDGKFGPEFKFKTIAMEAPKGRSGAIAFLEMIKGVSKVRARMIVDVLGDDAIAAICADSACLDRIPGFGKKLTRSISKQLVAMKVTIECEVTLVAMNIGQTVRRRVIDYFGAKLPEVIEENPYGLTVVDGVSFAKVDQWVARSGKFGTDSVERGAAVIVQSLKAQAEDGHTYQDLGTIMEGARKIKLVVPFPYAKLAASLEFAVAQKMVLSRKEGFGLSKLVLAEESIHEIVSRWLREPAQLGDVSFISKDIREMLTDEQRSAVQSAVTNRFSIMTGGPGTGKTLTSKGVLGAFPRTTVAVVAPTGKAAKRAQEVTGLPAMTIHRFIGITTSKLNDPDECGSPEEIIPQVVLVDEASMVDVELFAQLVELLDQRQQCRVVVVGDVDQLPSVGPGQILFDLIACGKVPVVRLTKVMRQQGTDNQIVDNAYLINAGRMPDNVSRASKQWQLGEASEIEKLHRWISIFLTSRVREMGFDPIKDVQVLTGQRQKELGCEGLNNLIRECLNPRSLGKKELTKVVEDKLVVLFREGDKVMNTENNQSLGVVNGDQGIVQKINVVPDKPKETTVEVLLDSGETINFRSGDLQSLVQAWAITVHKSQGSEYPVVVMICHDSLSWSLQRALLYTGVTRAKKHLVLFGTESAIQIAVRKERDLRMTRLTALFASQPQSQPKKRKKGAAK